MYDKTPSPNNIYLIYCFVYVGEGMMYFRVYFPYIEKKNHNLFYNF